MPVYSAGESDNGISLKDEFSHLNPLFANSVKRVNDHIEFSDIYDVKHILNEGIVVGFGAGDISNQLRKILWDMLFL